MELNWDIVDQNRKEVEIIIKESLEKIKNTSLYKNFKTGKVYKIIGKDGKEQYIIYYKPSLEKAGVIKGFPLNKELRFYEESYIQDFWVNWYRSIDEVADNLIREVKDGELTISDGDDSLTLNA